MAELTRSQVNRERLPSGGSELLTLLARLLRRPRRGDHRLPVFWLVRAQNAPDLVTVLRRAMMRGHRRRVPHAVVDVAAQPSGSGDVPALLRQIHQQLSLEAFGTERLRFRHYTLADWLMRQTLPEVGVSTDSTEHPQSLTPEVDSEERRVALARRLRDRHGLRRPDGEQSIGGADDVAATASQLAFWLIRRAIPTVLFRVAVTGRVPLFGRHYRWFMRQQYLAPQQSVSFIGFAERLTAGWRDGEQPDQVEKLLVHAFLEDLRQAYRRPLWRPASWRRTAYPLLLLDNVTPDSAGHALVRLINDVRNETGRNDPLLVVAVGPAPPPEVPRWDQLSDAEESYEEWVDGLPERRRLRRPDAWFIPLVVGDPNEGSEPRGGLLGFAAPNPPWWSRKLVIGAVCLALVAGGVTWASTRWGPDCHPQPFAGQVQVELVRDERIKDEEAAEQCIGYSDTMSHIFNPEQDELADVQRKIFTQNDKAEGRWQDGNKRRPYITLIYLGALTGQPTGLGEESYVSEREELEGLALVQMRLLDMSTWEERVPLLRVVVANGGYQMRHAVTATEMIGKLVRDDPTVVGVIGLVESRDSTEKALKVLNRIGLPVIATTLSADGFYENSQLYLQMSPANDVQARLIQRYVTEVLKAEKVRVYYTTGADSSLDQDRYVRTLVDGLSKHLDERLKGFPVPWDGDPKDEDCTSGDPLVFAGRWSEFEGFLSRLGNCETPPPVIADDSVNRYMANPELRRRAPDNVSMVYVSKAAAVNCVSLNQTGRGRTFLGWVKSMGLPEYCADGSSPPGERVGLAYDAATIVVDAVTTLAARIRGGNQTQPWDPGSINPLTVHTEVLRQTQNEYPGVTGQIRFAEDSGEPVNRPISLMLVGNVANDLPVEVYRCTTVDKVGDPPECKAVTAS